MTGNVMKWVARGMFLLGAFILYIWTRAGGSYLSLIFGVACMVIGLIIWWKYAIDQPPDSQ
jgi:hypothetical protein